ncbi:MAG: alpha/beta fold hydrolase [Solirubrobacteraceae bacterium]
MRRFAKLLVGVAIVIVIALVVNAYIITRETKSARADTGSLVTLPGAVSLQVREDGPRQAPDIVLLHGFDASLRWWQPSVLALARSYRVIRIDLLGHGGSAKPREGYSMPEQARLVAGVMRMLGVRRAVVAGHSMGAAVAIALAEQDPPLVRGLVVIDEPARPGQARFPLTAKLGFYPFIGPALRRLATDSLIYDAFKVGFAPGFRYPRWMVQDNRRMTYTSYEKSGKGEGAYVKARWLDRRLADVRKPVLVVFGTRDQIVEPGAWRTYRTVPRVRVRLIGGAGHSPMFEKPLATARAILAFAGRLRG